MSRSFHATRAAEARLDREDVSRPDVQSQALEHVRADLRQKRETKRVARAGRRRHGHAPTPAETVPVRREKAPPFVHFPADVEDVREVLRRLSRGVADGLAGVTLRLGRAAAEEVAGEAEYEPERDPFTGRASSLRFPGVWSGRVLGRYRGWAAEIEVFGYVADPAQPGRPVWMPLLRAEALATLAHEVAHHHDYTCRVARGRWIVAHREAGERYAETMQHRWTREVVIPWLRERYAGEVRSLERWVERHGGVALPFEELVDDPRVTGRGGFINATRAIFSMREAVLVLLACVGRGEPAWKCRLEFAREIHFTDRFDLALRVIDGVLAEQPARREARLARADVLRHLGRHAEALAEAEALVDEDAGCREALQVVMNSAAGMERWPLALEAATRLIELAVRGGEPVAGAVARRGELRLASGDVHGAREDLERAEAAGDGGRVTIRRLRRRIEAAQSGAVRPTRDLTPRRGWW